MLFNYPSGISVDELIELAIDIANTNIDQIPYVRQKIEKKSVQVKVQMNKTQIDENSKTGILCQRLDFVIETLKNNI
jgi:hypothetical protein